LLAESVQGALPARLEREIAMAIVVDTSIVIAVAANEMLKPRLIEMTRGEELVAPATLPWEI
jgi:hypothetical protein